MNDLITIIVPIYNVEEYLDRCVESIVKQTYTNIEILLVDDGSPDNCPAMCDAWAKKDSRIKVIHKTNGGLSDARNAGLDIANGKYIGFVDSDDYIEPQMYEKLYNTLTNTESDIVACKIKNVYDNAAYAVVSEDSEEITEYTSVDAMAALIEDKIRQVVWNKLYKADTIKDIWFDVGKYHEDEFWSYKAIGRASKITTIDYIGYNYLQRSNSIMGNNYSLKRLDAVDAKSLRQKYLEEHFPTLIQKGLINLIFTCIYHGQLTFKYLNKHERKIALQKLNKIFDANISMVDISRCNQKQKIWMFAAKISFYLTCKIRNMIGIGL